MKGTADRANPAEESKERKKERKKEGKKKEIKERKKEAKKANKQGRNGSNLIMDERHQGVSYPSNDHEQFFREGYVNSR